MSRKIPKASDSSISERSDTTINAEKYGNQSPVTRGSSKGLSDVISHFAKLRGALGKSEQPLISDASFTVPQDQHLDTDTIASLSGRMSDRVWDRESRAKFLVPAAQEITEKILRNAELKGSRFTYKASPDIIPILTVNLPDNPKLTTKVKVVAGDTYDIALAMYNEPNHKDYMPVCVLNFANAKYPGGGWLNGARAQEEQLCYRSTLSGCLQSRFYPMKEFECLYSPHVVVFRESADNNYKFMESHGIVSVISMAAESHPGLKAPRDRYANEKTRDRMTQKMRCILRAAAYNNHRRLVLGAIGCGAFGHPAKEVANCWKGVLLEKEFHGWFDKIHFAIRDAANENNLAVFKDALANVDRDM